MFSKVVLTCLLMATVALANVPALPDDTFTVLVDCSQNFLGLGAGVGLQLDVTTDNGTICLVLGAQVLAEACLNLDALGLSLLPVQLTGKLSAALALDLGLDLCLGGAFGLDVVLGLVATLVGLVGALLVQVIDVVVQLLDSVLSSPLLSVVSGLLQLVGNLLGIVTGLVGNVLGPVLGGLGK